MSTIARISQAFVDLWLDAAFWLLLGLMIAGLLHTFIKSDKLGEHLKGPGLWPVIKAAILGIPLPLCSCGVIPAAVGLRRAGASKGATTAFLISTPETGVDSIAVSYALLGPFMTIIRPIAAVCSSIAAAMLVLAGEKSVSQSEIRTEQPSTTCGAAGTQGNSSRCCCNSQQKQPANHQVHSDSIWRRIWQGQVYAFTDLLGDLSLWLLAGLIISAGVVALVPYDALAEISRGGWAMVVMACIGVPMYICASASTPLAAGLLMAGVSPGAVLVFLLAGPATNVATLGIVRREMGWHALGSYLTGMIGVAIGFGYLTNALVDFWHINIQSELGSSHDLMPLWLAGISALLLMLLIGNDLLTRIYQRLFKKMPTHSHSHHE
ncbi:SO_0444 family Cu/Zn efflux transporter [Vibrio rhizosphaerae]|uniref:SO_0444 family Cu/Zn efflux transporter n=1 Tax=Vibrio rhizosphaerae TaxID=398736 RepID=A0ABU4IW43_9VIBR|nr:SO_0444 family Cu/Zn efflux transporter [Vibrio rhizosphaerae]MDW6093327.1 SO_0444 family Cu/Zn efflux transporter [Vibrio rhizosphaerae]